MEQQKHELPESPHSRSGLHNSPCLPRTPSRSVPPSPPTTKPAPSQEYIGLMRQMIKTLGLKQTLKQFNAETSQPQPKRNPEQSTAKKKEGEALDQLILQKRIDTTIKDSKNMEQMMDELLRVGSGVEAEEGELHAAAYRALQNLLPSKQSATVPVYRNLQIEHHSKEVKLIDISQSGTVAIVDSDFELHIIDSAKKVNKIKLEGKKKLIGLRWVYEDKLMLLGMTGKCIIYDAKLEHFKNVRVARAEISCLDCSVQPAEEGSMVRVCLGLANHRVSVCDINITSKSAFVSQSASYQTAYSLQTVTWLLQQPVAKSQFSSRAGLIHLYSLMEGGKAIVKHDQQVGVEGIFWQCLPNQIIQSFRSSHDHLSLMMVVKCRHQVPGAQHQLSPTYEFVKLDGRGATVARVEIDLQGLIIRQIGVFVPTVQIGSVCWLEPDWLGCLPVDNTLLYFSFHSGKILYQQELEVKPNQVQYCPAARTLLLHHKSNLYLMTEHQAQKEKVVLSCTGLDRESRFTRLSRLQGIPQNLLLLLRSIRNNDLSLLDI